MSDTTPPQPDVSEMAKVYGQITETFVSAAESFGALTLLQCWFKTKTYRKRLAWLKEAHRAAMPVLECGRIDSEEAARSLICLAYALGNLEYKFRYELMEKKPR